MKVQVSWLQEYIEEKLPAPKELAEVLSLRAFEVEEIDGTDERAVIDVDILPNRAHDGLSHRGIARELAALFGLTFKERAIQKESSKASTVAVSVKDPGLCRRYVALPISGIEVKASPKWLKERLQAIGERSINNVVDITNFVMFDLGQPLHAFDRKKIDGDKIYVRPAKEGEEMTTLDGFDLQFGGGELVIADEKGVLALAGVKGGKKAEVDENTTEIVLEAASFDPVSVRKTSRGIGIITESSKRFENEPTSDFALTAAYLARDLIAGSSDKEVLPEKAVDVYPNPATVWEVDLTVSEIEEVLGIAVSTTEAMKILDALKFKVEESNGILKVRPPIDRLDITIPEDVIEEIGRIYGYEKLDPKLPETREEELTPNKRFYYQAKIRAILQGLGFSEIFTYSIREKGEIELANPLTSDRKFLRDELTSDMEKALLHNERYIEMVGDSRVRLFEISNIFKKGKEETHLAIGVKNTKKKQKPKEKELIEKALSELSQQFGVKVEGSGSFSSEMVWEADIDQIIEELDDPKEWDLETKSINSAYRPISPYPFVLRDIAVFTPEEVKSEEVLDIIKKEAGELLTQHRLFDVYQKTDEQGKKWISYAYRLVFISHEKTLSDAEVNEIMDKITAVLNSQKDWQVR
ncbi:MAG: phenylalanine--tRNA ligase subunit beta [Candidatus Paceibacterota bacterium]